MFTLDNKGVCSPLVLCRFRGAVPCPGVGLQFDAGRPKPGRRLAPDGPGVQRVRGHREVPVSMLIFSYDLLWSVLVQSVLVRKRFFDRA